jgi:hypothetical protein
LAVAKTLIERFIGYQQQPVLLAMTYKLFCFYIFGGFMSIVYIFEASVSKYSGNRIVYTRLRIIRRGSGSSMGRGLRCW